MPKTLAAARTWLGARGPLVLFAVLAVVLGTWAFIALADEVREGGTQRFDDRVNAFCYHHRGPRWVQETGRDLTALGGVVVLGLVVAAVAGYLLISRKYRAMGLVLAATLGGFGLSTVLKAVMDRPRPPLVPPSTIVYTTSFPSGHSMLSAVIYLTLGSLLARVMPGRLLKLYFLLLALCLTFLVGVSRVYLCAHYPTDVLAGWSAGLAWALICWIAAKELQRRGALETAAEGEGRLEGV